MSRRYLFLCPDSQKASGGIAVIYDIVTVLQRARFEAFVLHNAPKARYPNHPESPPRFYTHVWKQTLLRHAGRRHRFWAKLHMWRESLRGGDNPPIQLRETDLLVVPEYMIAEAMEAFPETELAVLLQNPFSFQRAFLTGLKRGYDIRSRARIFLGVSRICMDQFDLLGIAGGHYLPVSMQPEAFPFQAEKEPLITYMPYKRRDEARLVAAALDGRPELVGYRLEAIDNLPREEVSERLQRSRFFLSLQKHESIGFPAAEAMAAGCIVVGYTGLGGREYFDTTTGIPVTEDDTAGLVAALLATVREHAKDPAKFEALRRHASAEINRRYAHDQFEDALLRIWREIDL